METRLAGTNLFLYHKKSRPTGRAIAEQLGISFGLNAKKVRSLNLLIRWGSQVEIGVPCKSTLNNPSALALASNKLRALRKFKDSGINVPDFSETPDLSYPMLGRSLSGFAGKDIQVYQTGETVYNHDFYTTYIPNTREYRLHVFQGSIIRTQGKYLDSPERYTNKYVKNHNSGFVFRTPDKQLNTDRQEAAIEAVRCLGLDFGAVDLLIGEDKKCYVLEVNTAPACSPMTIEAYVSSFRSVLQK